ncbi:hypothetical protein NDA01_15365 [Trichocoleus desertorum AS-A10]|uniref:hypothetical protein n=1 Tax=Trichocoleus desertorum TaxID=1481672 RepID=UPI0032980774
MNEHLRIFQSIEQSVDQLLKNEYSSIESREMKGTATNLNASIQPCIQEIRLSALKLKELIKPCFQNLIEAEDVWNSKLRITETSRDKIWQEIGEISAYHFRIQKLATHQKAKLIEESRSLWKERIEESRKTWFLDGKKQLKAGIGWPRKEDFSKYMLSKMTSHFQQVDSHIKKDLNLLVKEVDNQYSIIIKSYASLFDLKSKNKLVIEIDKRLKEMQLSCTNLLPSLSSSYLKGVFSPTFNAWKSQWGDIPWTEVARLEEEVTGKSDQRIKFMIDSRVDLMKKALEQAIAFYNEFLEEQECYQQETPEQRLAEKAWIDHQRQELEKLKASFNSILESSTN